MEWDRTEAIDGPVPAHVKGLPSLTGRLARKAMSPTLKQLDTGMLHLDLPSGERIEVRGTKPGPEAVLRLKTWRALVRLAIGGDIGFAEGYMYGDWTTPDRSQVEDFLGIFAEKPGQYLVHCLGGVGRTGVFVSCYRIAQGMEPASAIRQT